ncbi:hypothetical protein [Aliarcobacter skirrowii]|uniref:Membrane protein n=1 Tax=Aliarcobacter skirrowii CCUG 10374 TaxID=1032239 RepID=A0AAD0WNW9_9BACT|nr:hypothetical protein [Aliarcobacter skirrowii]AXX85319.1 putative membrane protein [Aliarcobacter skirrowii CCUG 10374]KAB0620147.1 hypothetical protein F7P70_08900 [Aliarcobacter skirrowii CCUG 10374]RXI25215.1 hypothetical protein CP959_08935 [Aliarcobacter skirrowii CCUG 10374]SUU96147.1 Uncharacterised protein [Aliarcobacter skirrowii]
MKNSLASKVNGIFLTAIFSIIMGIITILSPSYTKWGNDIVSNIIIGIIYVIIGSIVAIVQIISIYKSYKKDKEN